MDWILRQCLIEELQEKNWWKTQWCMYRETNTFSCLNSDLSTLWEWTKWYIQSSLIPSEIWRPKEWEFHSCTQSKAHNQCFDAVPGQSCSRTKETVELNLRLWLVYFQYPQFAWDDITYRRQIPFPVQLQGLEIKNFINAYQNDKMQFPIRLSDIWNKAFPFLGKRRAKYISLISYPFW